MDGGANWPASGAFFFPLLCIFYKQYVDVLLTRKTIKLSLKMGIQARRGGTRLESQEAEVGRWPGSLVRPVTKQTSNQGRGGASSISLLAAAFKGPFELRPKASIPHGHVHPGGFSVCILNSVVEMDLIPTLRTLDPRGRFGFMVICFWSPLLLRDSHELRPSGGPPSPLFPDPHNDWVGPGCLL